jgi:hypothetical protein
MRLFALLPAFVPSLPPTASATFSPVTTNTTQHFDTNTTRTIILTMQRSSQTKENHLHLAQSFIDELIH